MQATSGGIALRCPLAFGPISFCSPPLRASVQWHGQPSATVRLNLAVAERLPQSALKAAHRRHLAQMTTAATLTPNQPDYDGKQTESPPAAATHCLGFAAYKPESH